MEIYIIRHGETDWNTKRCLQGQSDIALNKVGREQAGTTGRILEKVPFDLIYSSPLDRAYETACLIRGHRNIQIMRHEKIKELGFGTYEGKNALELTADKTDPFHYFFSRPELYQAPKGGETLDSICKRTAAFLQEEIETKEKEYERIMIVGHGACNKALMCHIRNHGIAQFWQGNLQKNCSVSIIKYEKGSYSVLEDNVLLYTE